MLSIDPSSSSSSLDAKVEKKFFSWENLPKFNVDVYYEHIKSQDTADSPGNKKPQTIILIEIDFEESVPNNTSWKILSKFNTEQWISPLISLLGVVGMKRQFKRVSALAHVASRDPKHYTISKRLVASSALLKLVNRTQSRASELSTGSSQMKDAIYALRRTGIITMSSSGELQIDEEAVKNMEAIFWVTAILQCLYILWNLWTFIRRVIIQKKLQDPTNAVSKKLITYILDSITQKITALRKHNKKRVVLKFDANILKDHLLELLDTAKTTKKALIFNGKLQQIDDSRVYKRFEEVSATLGHDYYEKWDTTRMLKFTEYCTFLNKEIQNRALLASFVPASTLERLRFKVWKMQDSWSNSSIYKNYQSSLNNYQYLIIWIEGNIKETHIDPDEQNFMVGWFKRGMNLPLIRGMSTMLHKLIPNSLGDFLIGVVFVVIFLVKITSGGSAMLEAASFLSRRSDIFWNLFSYSTKLSFNVTSSIITRMGNWLKDMSASERQRQEVAWEWKQEALKYANNLARSTKSKSIGIKMKDMLLETDVSAQSSKTSAFSSMVTIAGVCLFGFTAALHGKKTVNEMKNAIEKVQRQVLNHNKFQFFDKNTKTGRIYAHVGFLSENISENVIDIYEQLFIRGRLFSVILKDDATLFKSYSDLRNTLMSNFNKDKEAEKKIAQKEEGGMVQIPRLKIKINEYLEPQVASVQQTQVLSPDALSSGDNFKSAMTHTAQSGALELLATVISSIATGALWFTALSSGTTAQDLGLLSWSESGLDEVTPSKSSSDISDSNSNVISTSISSSTALVDLSGKFYAKLEQDQEIMGTPFFISNPSSNNKDWPWVNSWVNSIEAIINYPTMDYLILADLSVLDTSQIRNSQASTLEIPIQEDLNIDFQNIDLTDRIESVTVITTWSKFLQNETYTPRQRISTFLGIPPDSEIRLFRKEYRKCTVKFHPDKFHPDKYPKNIKEDVQDMFNRFSNLWTLFYKQNKDNPSPEATTSNTGFSWLFGGILGNNNNNDGTVSPRIIGVGSSNTRKTASNIDTSTSTSSGSKSDVDDESQSDAYPVARRNTASPSISNGVSIYKPTNPLESFIGEYLIEYPYAWRQRYNLESEGTTQLTSKSGGEEFVTSHNLYLYRTLDYEYFEDVSQATLDLVKKYNPLVQKAKTEDFVHLMNTHGPLGIFGFNPDDIPTTENIQAAYIAMGKAFHEIDNWEGHQITENIKLYINFIIYNISFDMLRNRVFTMPKVFHIGSSIFHTTARSEIDSIKINFDGFLEERYSMESTNSPFLTKTDVARRYIGLFLAAFHYTGDYGEFGYYCRQYERLNNKIEPSFKSDAVFTAPKAEEITSLIEATTIATDTVKEITRETIYTLLSDDKKRVADTLIKFSNVFENNHPGQYAEKHWEQAVDVFLEYLKAFQKEIPKKYLRKWQLKPIDDYISTTSVYGGFNYYYVHENPLYFSEQWKKYHDGYQIIKPIQQVYKKNNNHLNKATDKQFKILLESHRLDIFNTDMKTNKQCVLNLLAIDAAQSEYKALPVDPKTLVIYRTTEFPAFTSRLQQIVKTQKPQETMKTTPTSQEIVKSTPRSQGSKLAYKSVGTYQDSISELREAFQIATINVLTQGLQLTVKNIYANFRKPDMGLISGAITRLGANLIFSPKATSGFIDGNGNRIDEQKITIRDSNTDIIVGVNTSFYETNDGITGLNDVLQTVLFVNEVLPKLQTAGGYTDNVISPLSSSSKETIRGVDFGVDINDRIKSLIDLVHELINTGGIPYNFANQNISTPKNNYDIVWLNTTFETTFEEISFNPTGVSKKNKQALEKFKEMAKFLFERAFSVFHSSVNLAVTSIVGLISILIIVILKKAFSSLISFFKSRLTKESITDEEKGQDNRGVYGVIGGTIGGDVGASGSSTGDGDGSGGSVISSASKTVGGSTSMESTTDSKHSGNGNEGSQRIQDRRLFDVAIDSKTNTHAFDDTKKNNAKDLLDLKLEITIPLGNTYGKTLKHKSLLYQIRSFLPKAKEVLDESIEHCMKMVHMWISSNSTTGERSNAASTEFKLNLPSKMILEINTGEEKISKEYSYSYYFAIQYICLFLTSSLNVYKGTDVKLYFVWESVLDNQTAINSSQILDLKTIQKTESPITDRIKSWIPQNVMTTSTLGGLSSQPRKTSILGSEIKSSISLSRDLQSNISTISQPKNISIYLSNVLTDMYVNPINSLSVLPLILRRDKLAFSKYVVWIWLSKLFFAANLTAMKKERDGRAPSWRSYRKSLFQNPILNPIAKTFIIENLMSSATDLTFTEKIELRARLSQENGGLQKMAIIYSLYLRQISKQRPISVPKQDAIEKIASAYTKRYTDLLPKQMPAKFSHVQITAEVDPSTLFLNEPPTSGDKTEYFNWIRKTKNNFRSYVQLVKAKNKAENKPDMTTAIAEITIEDLFSKIDIIVQEESQLNNLNYSSILQTDNIILATKYLITIVLVLSLFYMSNKKLTRLETAPRTAFIEKIKAKFDANPNKTTLILRSPFNEETPLKIYRVFSKEVLLDTNWNQSQEYLFNYNERNQWNFV